MAVKRRIIGFIIVVARVLGRLFIALAILGLPQIRFLTGSLAGSLGLLSSIALVFAGIAWLVAVELFIRVFDQHLSRN